MTDDDTTPPDKNKPAKKPPAKPAPPIEPSSLKGVDPAVMELIKGMQQQIKILTDERDQAIDAKSQANRQSLLERLKKKGQDPKLYEDKSTESLELALTILGDTPDVGDKTQEPLKSDGDIPDDKGTSFGGFNTVTKQWENDYKEGLIESKVQAKK